MPRGCRSVSAGVSKCALTQASRQPGQVTPCPHLPRTAAGQLTATQFSGLRHVRLHSARPPASVAHHGQSAHPWQCLSSAPAPPQGAPGGPVQLGVPREGRGHWKPKPRPQVLEVAALLSKGRSPISLRLTTQAELGPFGAVSEAECESSQECVSSHECPHPSRHRHLHSRYVTATLPLRCRYTAVTEVPAPVPRPRGYPRDGGRGARHGGGGDGVGGQQ